MNKLIYLASLYSLRADEHLMQARFERVERVAVTLLKDGHQVFSPIVYNHAMALKYEMPKTFDFWRTLDSTFISHCDELWILVGDMDYRESTGVTEEIKIAKECGVPIKVVNFVDMSNTYGFSEHTD